MVAGRSIAEYELTVNQKLNSAMLLPYKVFWREGSKYLTSQFPIGGKFDFMEPIPVPSPIHYELILQLLERQTMFAVSHNPDLKDKVQQLIISMRKAVALQKQVEQICEQKKLSVDYRWALNHVAPKTELEKNPDRFT